MSTEVMTTTVQATCLCGRNTETLQLNSQLPVPTASCSCNSCRYSTGVLYFSCLPLPSKPDSVDNLTKYNSSSELTRFFCPECGSPMFVHVAKDDAWTVCSGVIDHVPMASHEQVSSFSLEKIMQHEFVGDTKDGGLAVCLADFDHDPVPLFLQGPDGASLPIEPNVRFMTFGPDDPPPVDTPTRNSVEVSESSNDLHGECHCGGFAFYVTRPNAASRACSSPWPDLLVPYHSSSSENCEDIKWWLRANGSKYLAGTCACRSCRLGSGSPIQAWAFVPKANLLQFDGTPFTYGTGSLRQIESSKDCFREFCGTCGATIFWHCRERPDLVDVSVGLLRAKEGSRAMTWLDWWTERVSFKEDALDKALIENLEKGLGRINKEG